MNINSITTPQLQSNTSMPNLGALGEQLQALSLTEADCVRIISEVEAGDLSSLAKLGLVTDDVTAPTLPAADFDAEALASALGKLSSLDILALMDALLQMEKLGRQVVQGKRLESRDEIVTSATAGANSLRESAEKNFNISVVVGVVGIVGGTISLVGAALEGACAALSALLPFISTAANVVQTVVKAVNNIISAITSTLSLIASTLQTASSIYGAIEGKNAADCDADATEAMGESNKAKSKEKEEAEIYDQVKKVIEDVEKLLEQVLAAQEETNSAIQRNM